MRFLARDLFGCDDALAVNNNASAVLLALAALARGREVLVSRGELVAIGGSFQIPEILEASGARLREVGTTNRTTIADYRRALGPETALLLTVHPSNYEIRGYVRRAGTGELSALAREAGIPWLHDQGTGCVVPLDEFGVPDEATVAQCLASGADLVSLSCDKLFSGPQAGLLVGTRGARGARRQAPHRAGRAARQARPGRSRRDAPGLEDGRVARVPDLPRGVGHRGGARGPRWRPPRTGPEVEDSDRHSRSLAGRVRGRHQPRETLRLPRARGRERDALGRTRSRR